MSRSLNNINIKSGYGDGGILGQNYIEEGGIEL